MSRSFPGGKPEKPCWDPNSRNWEEKQTQLCTGHEDFALLNHTKKWHQPQCPGMTQKPPAGCAGTGTCERKALFSWPGVPSHPGDGHGEQEEQEGSTGFPLALCGVINTESSAPGSCQSTRSRLQPEHLMLSFFFLVNWRKSVPLSLKGKSTGEKGMILKYSFGPVANR